MTWIFLRGLAREAAHWGTFAGEFSAALGGEPVETVDLPGSGVFHANSSPASVAQIMEGCRREIGRRALRPPFDVLAMSLGAMVAVAWAHAHPSELRRGVLLNTSLRPFSPSHQRLQPANYVRLARALLTSDCLARERRVLRMTSSRYAARAGVIDEWVGINHARPVARVNVLRQLLAAARYRAPLTRPRCDVLMLASTRDRLVEVRCSRAIAYAWQVPLVEHPTAGHDLPLDDPWWVIEQVRTWVARPAR
jgi:pimeloyl-ACP methyl ester carboxylesterase